VNIRHGLDIQTWIDAGLVDWVMVSFYPFFGVECDLPIEWLTHMRMNSLGGSPKSSPKFTEVYGRINPWVRDGSSGGSEDQSGRVYADTATLRAAAANHLHKGAESA